MGHRPGDGGQRCISRVGATTEVVLQQLDAAVVLLVGVRCFRIPKSPENVEIALAKEIADLVELQPGGASISATFAHDRHAAHAGGHVHHRVEPIWDGSLLSSIKEARRKAKATKLRRARAPVVKPKAQEAREKKEAFERENEITERRALDQKLSTFAELIVSRLSAVEVSDLAPLFREKRWEAGQALAGQIYAAIEDIPFQASQRAASGGPPG